MIDQEKVDQWGVRKMNDAEAVPFGASLDTVDNCFPSRQIETVSSRKIRPSLLRIY